MIPFVTSLTCSLCVPSRTVYAGPDDLLRSGNTYFDFKPTHNDNNRDSHSITDLGEGHNQ